jgi:type IV pilus assembly protein PilE
MNKIHTKGFTLIELMVILTIVAILVALAIPSFRDTLRKSRRSDAMNAILGIHLAQERWRVNHTTYGALTDLGIDGTSPDGHYVLTIEDEDEHNFTIIATAQGDQAVDSCGNFKSGVEVGVICKNTSKGDASICWKAKSVNECS